MSATDPTPLSALRGLIHDPRPSRALNLREEMTARLIQFRDGASDKLLREWVTNGGHDNHKEWIARLWGSGIPENVERYRCQKDWAQLDLQTDTEIDGDTLRVTVTPRTS